MLNFRRKAAAPEPELGDSTASEAHLHEDPALGLAAEPSEHAAEQQEHAAEQQDHAAGLLEPEAHAAPAAVDTAAAPQVIAPESHPLYTPEVAAEALHVDEASVEGLGQEALLVDESAGEPVEAEEVDTALAAPVLTAREAAARKKAARPQKASLKFKLPFKLGKKAAADEPLVSPVAETAGFEGPVSKPIRLIVGFLPEVTARDALQFARGMAEKYLESISVGYVATFPYRNGYAYEIQEGGNGRAYLDSIIKYYDSLPDYVGDDEDTSSTVIVETGTRNVRIERTPTGIVGLQLPVSIPSKGTAWLKPGRRMKPLVDNKQIFVVASAIFMVISFFLFIVTSFTRFQPVVTPPIPAVAKVDLNKLPNSQWNELARVSAESYVKALRYKNGKWDIDKETVKGSGTLPPPPLPPTGANAAKPTPTSAVPGGIPPAKGKP